MSPLPWLLLWIKNQHKYKYKDKYKYKWLTSLYVQMLQRLKNLADLLMSLLTLCQEDGLSGDKTIILDKYTYNTNTQIQTHIRKCKPKCICQKSWDNIEIMKKKTMIDKEIYKRLIFDLFLML